MLKHFSKTSRDLKSNNRDLLSNNNPIIERRGESGSDDSLATESDISVGHPQ